MTLSTTTYKTIAIDGPAGSGKSTIGQALAEQLNYLFFDTGVLYRAVTAVALQRDFDLYNEPAINALSREILIDVRPPTADDSRQYTIIVDHGDMTWALRTPQVDSYVSIVAAYPEVRVALTAQMRVIGKRGDVVMVGRDIGTIVMPDADVKIYLDASIEARARRRYIECQKRGDDRSYETILAGLRERDKIDSQRDTAPLRAADDAHRLDTTHMTPEQVLAAIKSLLT